MTHEVACVSLEWSPSCWRSSMWEHICHCHYLQHQCAEAHTSPAAMLVSLFVNTMSHAAMSVSLSAPSVCLNTDRMCYLVNVTICNISATKKKILLVLLMQESPPQINCFMKQFIYTYNTWSQIKRLNLYPRKNHTVQG